MPFDENSINSEMKSSLISRRRFLGYSFSAAFAVAFEPLAQFIIDKGWSNSANAQENPLLLIEDTMNGLVAFIVPGPDDYSVHQGASTEDPGGIEANIIDVLIESIDAMQPPPPPFPSTSLLVATVLNNIALAINPSPPGTFPSAFSRLSFNEKVKVFFYMESDPSLRTIAILLPVFVGFISFSEAGVFDPVTRTLTGQPVGWTLASGYTFAHGHDEFIGYYENRRSADY